MGMVISARVYRFRSWQAKQDERRPTIQDHINGDDKMASETCQAERRHIATYFA
jgi:hypothetical protein